MKSWGFGYMIPYRNNGLLLKTGEVICNWAIFSEKRESFEEKVLEF